ncbi:hypothetical protein AOLI_G00241440 [Acnodon oligacanthus]
MVTTAAPLRDEKRAEDQPTHLCRVAVGSGWRLQSLPGQHLHHHSLPNKRNQKAEDSPEEVWRAMAMRLNNCEQNPNPDKTKTRRRGTAADSMDVGKRRVTLRGYFLAVCQLLIAEEAVPRADPENEWPFLCEPLSLEVTPSISEQGKRTRGLNHIGIKGGEAVPPLEEPRPEPQTRPATIAKGNDIMQHNHGVSKKEQERDKETTLRIRAHGVIKTTEGMLTESAQRTACTVAAAEGRRVTVRTTWRRPARGGSHQSGEPAFQHP